MKENIGLLNGKSVRVIVEGYRRLCFLDEEGQTAGEWLNEQPLLTSDESTSSLTVRSFTLVFDDKATAAHLLSLYGSVSPQPVPQTQAETTALSSADTTAFQPHQSPSSTITNLKPSIFRTDASRQNRAALAFDRAARAALVVEGFGWIILVLGTIVGLIMLGSSSQENGLVVILASLFYGAPTIMVAAYIQGRSQQ